jgi:hypothetical protein
LIRQISLAKSLHQAGKRYFGRWQPDYRAKNARGIITEMVPPFAVWMLARPRNAETGKPEWNWFKAIQGNNSFYVVQKTFKFEPARLQIIEWTRYLKGVKVCDTRGSEHRCSAGVK